MPTIVPSTEEELRLTHELSSAQLERGRENASGKPRSRRTYVFRIIAIVSISALALLIVGILAMHTRNGGAPRERRKLRFLCIHGIFGNSELMAERLASFKAALGGDGVVEFDFVEGLIPTEGEAKASLQATTGRQGPFLAWYKTEHDAGSINNFKEKEWNRLPKMLLDDQVTFNIGGLDEALDKVEGHIAMHGPYDVLVGFSQGTTMITMATRRMLERNASRKSDWPRAAVLFSPMMPRGGPYAVVQQPPPEMKIECTKAIGVFGDSDPFHEYQQLVFDVWNQVEQVDFIGGHDVPTDGETCDEIAVALYRLLSL